MEHKIMHRSYRPTIGGKAVPNDKMINDLGKDAIYYIGSFSEYNPIALMSACRFSSGLAIYIKKETTSSINQQKPFILYGFKASAGTGYHGSDFNNNVSIELTKEELFRIANAMNDTDTMQIAVPDSIDEIQFKEGIKKVTGT